jgi:5-methylcytosine-specific restriction endonuclease McrA
VPIRPENRGRYPEDWAAVRERILARAVGDAGVAQCECRGECGRGTHPHERCPNVQGGLAYGTGSVVVLTIAHLDHQPEHNDSSNLRAMCQGCHLHYDKEHHAESRARNLRAARAAAGQTEPEVQ